MADLKSKKNTIYTGIVVAILLISLSGYILYNMSLNSENNERPKLPKINRELSFPRDEGGHKELSEGWVVSMNLTSEEGKHYYVTVTWGMTDTGDPKIGINYGASFYFSNESSKVPWTIQDVKFDKTYVSNKSLNLNFTTKKDIFYINRTNPSSSMHEAEYDLFVKVRGNQSFILNLDMKASNVPIPLDRNGTIKLGILGMSYGYFQNKIDITGSLKSSEYSGTVYGKAFIYHVWGYLNVVTDFFMMKMKENDLGLVRLYATGTYNLVAEYLYVIYEDSYTLFITYNNSYTIGMDININTREYRDLSGETYTVHIEDYFVDPTDPYHHRCLPKTWFIHTSYKNYTAIVRPMLPPNYPSISRWIEPMNGKDSFGFGWGFGELDRHKRSDIQIKDIRYRETEIEGKKFFEIETSISNGIPLNNVTVYYNVSGQQMHAPMYWDSEKMVWTVRIGPFDTGDVVDFRIRVEDAAYSVKFSEENTITVS